MRVKAEIDVSADQGMPKVANKTPEARAKNWGRFSHA